MYRDRRFGTDYVIPNVIETISSIIGTIQSAKLTQISKQ